MSRTTEEWLRRARFLAWATVIYNLLEGLVSMGFGWSDHSVSLFGFGADSFIEVGSALLVLWRLNAADSCAGSRLARERKATRWIGVLFLLLAAGTVGGALLDLAGQRHPETSLPGLVVSLASLGFMAWLYRAKCQAAKALDSRTLEGDAACSLACIQLSCVLLVGSAAFVLAPRLWWADAVAALTLSFLFAKEGWSLWRAASKADFTGGCGCH